MIGTTAAILGGALISGIGGIGSSVINKKAATSASNDLQKGATEAGNQIVETAGRVNPAITEAAATAGAGVTKAAGDAGAGMWSATDRANDLLDPYRAGGDETMQSLRVLLAPGGELNRNFSAEDIKNLDPGFQFRLQEAEKALSRSAAARGGAMGGGALRELTRYSQGVAEDSVGKAFDRLQAQQTNRFDRLFGVTKLGAGAAETQGNRFIDAGKYSGDVGLMGSEYQGNATMHAADLTGANELEAARAKGDFITQAANAAAAGKVAGANAISTGITGATNSISGALTLRELLKRTPQPVRYV